MTHVIEEIILGKGFEAYDCAVEASTQDPKRIEKLEKINVFVGANNSGKSQFMRRLACIKNPSYELRSELRPYGLLVRELPKILARLATEFNALCEPHNIAEIDNALITLTNVMGKITAPGLRDGGAVLESVFNTLTDFSTRTNISAGNIRMRFGYTAPAAEREAKRILIQWSTQALKEMEHLQKWDTKRDTFTRLYVPTLRSLRRFENGVLEKHTREDYKLEKDIIVFTGETLYSSVDKLNRTSYSTQQKIEKFQRWIGESFFDGQSVRLTATHGDTILTIKIGDEIEKKIHELGDGIQSILILTFELFRREDEYLIGFFEEPEIFLHPWLQRVFLRTLATEFPKHQYFFTTHSNHFLDLTLDMSGIAVYTFEKELVGEVEGQKQPKILVQQISGEEKKPLELLGVRNSSVMLSNCTIWVEGITDRRYVSRWLELYDNEQLTIPSKARQRRLFKEDLHYSFVEYGGSAITHFSFLEDGTLNGPKRINVERLCAKLFLITDNDGAGPRSKKAQRFETLSKNLGDNYHCLKGREIENLVSPEVLIKILEARGEKVSAPLDQKDYLKTGLGLFLDKFLQKPNEIVPRTYAKPGADDSTSGTIADKNLFCDLVLSMTTSWSQLSDQAKELTITLYNFISAHNKE